MILYDEKIESSFDAVVDAVHEIDARIALFCHLIDSATLFKINFMLREILNNAVEHGNHFDSEKKVHCQVKVEQSRLFFVIIDQGSGIDLSCNPFTEDCVVQIAHRKRGYATIKELDFEVAIDGNKVTVILDLTEEAKLCKKM